MDIHQKIKLVRLMSGYRQSDLADLLDIKQSVIARYETAGGRIPRAEAIQTIAETTGWPVDWFENDRLEGLIVTSLTLPHISYTETALATIERGISSVLPDLFSLPAFKGAKVCRLDQAVLHRGTGITETQQIYIIHTDSLCFIIFPSCKFNSLINKYINSHFENTSTKNPMGKFFFNSIWTQPYGEEFVNLLKYAEIPGNLINLAIERKPPATKGIKIVMEVSAPAGINFDLIKEAQLALGRSLIKVHSIKML